MIRTDNYTGVVLLNKPRGMSSHDAVAIMRRIAGQRSVGHAGTLDPLADGLLVLCLGRATKVSQYLTGLSKRYDATVTLGQTSPTFDAEGIDEKTPFREVPALGIGDIAKVLRLFTGEIRQRVPVFSAVSVGGRRLYEAARRGEEIEAPVRTVTISEMTISDYTAPHIRISVACSKGTYIRSLADDIGAALGCGGYLAALTRTAIGELTLEDAFSFEQLEALAADSRLGEALLPLERVLPFGAMLVTDSMADRVVHGPQIGWEDIVQFEGTFRSGEPVLLKNSQGRILAVGKACVDSDQAGGSDHTLPLFSYARVLA
jgi:tRNA pseudouridine55 synthase